MFHCLSPASKPTQCSTFSFNSHCHPCVSNTSSFMFYHLSPTSKLTECSTFSFNSHCLPPTSNTSSFMFHHLSAASKPTKSSAFSFNSHCQPIQHQVSLHSPTSKPTGCNAFGITLLPPSTFQACGAAHFASSYHAHAPHPQPLQPQQEQDQTFSLRSY